MAGALDARGIPSYPDKLVAEVEGDIEKIERRPVVTQVRVKYSLKIPAGKRAEAERALNIHEQGCPVAMSLKRGIALSWQAEIVEE
ncbi:MAG: OsmC family protein [Acidobacteria bacterium]|nr:OsmC family protein [Acidobacteriota bacterium]MCI0722182.1 OsmC family protein [Acidobacteriota bacterium]